MSNPAGWYDDPFLDDTLRYWNGETWTKDTLPKPPVAPPPVDSAWRAVESTSAPGMGAAPQAAASGAPRIVDYLIPSILALLFCAWPLAIPAIIFSAKARGSVKRSDLAAATQQARNARLWIILSGVFGIVIWAYMIYLIATTGQSPITTPNV